MGFWRWVGRLFGSGSFSRPEDACPYILRRFDELTERDFAPLESALMRKFRHSSERDLIYALRVSLHVAKITSLKTLADRWNTAHSGAGARGLMMASDSRNYRSVQAFLLNRYLQRFEQISSELISKAALKKTTTAKTSALEKAKQKIREAQYGFVYPIPGLEKLLPPP